MAEDARRNRCARFPASAVRAVLRTAASHAYEARADQRDTSSLIQGASADRSTIEGDPMPRHLTDRQVVDAFVAHRAATDHPGISVQSRPDEVERNRSAVDAIAGSLAIEHTSIDTIANQRRDGERFMQVVSEIESELSPKVPFCLRIVFPYHGIRTGQDWSEMKRGFRAWIANLTPPWKTGGRRCVSLVFRSTWRSRRPARRLDARPECSSPGPCLRSLT